MTIRSSGSTPPRIVTSRFPTWSTSKPPASRRSSSAIGAFAELAGPVINGYAFCDLKKQEATELSAIEWTEANPYHVILMDTLPAKSGDRETNLKAAIDHLNENAAKARAYFDDPKNLADFSQKRKANGADAKFCWR